MSLEKYQVVVQWSQSENRYEAYSPTLIGHARMFVPDFPKTAYGNTIAEAAENYATQANKLLQVFKNLAILPPPADVGPASIGDSAPINELGTMVL